MNPTLLQERVTQYDPETDLYNTEEDKILKDIYKVCRTLSLYNINDRLDTFIILLNFNSTEFSSEISRLQMRFIHLVNNAHSAVNDDVRLLEKLASCPQVPGNHRLECMAALFRQSYFKETYKIAYEIAKDQKINIHHRKECIYLLFGSENEEYQNLGVDACKSLVSNGTFQQSKEIMGLIFNLGQEDDLQVNIIDTQMSYEYDEKYSVPIFIEYFFNHIYNIHYKILAAQFLIQTSYGEDPLTKIKLLDEIYKLACQDNEKITQGMRGDCGDFLIQWSGLQEYEEKGRDIIDKIKFANVPVGLRNIYTNTENIHEDNILGAINKFITERLIPNTDNVPSYVQESILQDISEYIYKIKNPNALYKALDSFDRIKNDNTKFTKDKIVSVKILCYIWNYIRMDIHKKIDKKALLNRFMQEMVDMHDTCTSGHIGRLINVLDGTITITFSQQIVANIQGRITSKLKQLSDEDTKEKVILALMETADLESKQELNNWVMSFRDELYSELKEEFVIGEVQFVTQQEFDIAFSEGLNGWILDN